MGHVVYILQSETSGKFYTGQTNDLQKRLEFHNHGIADKFTLRHRPWQVFHTINCDSRSQAKKIEAHIKQMKSAKFIQNLKAFPELTDKLLDKYSDDASDC